MGTLARHRKTGNLTLRISPDDKEMIERAAAMLGEDVTTFVLSPAVGRARELAERESVTTLTGAARARFIELLENPPAPSERLMRNLREQRYETVE
jgi:uncharacterized protein (DUF1778 family)